MIRMRSLDPDAVEAFVLVADLASFTRAARVLNSTQAAVSLRLRRLEDRLGQRLLERTPRQVRLSAAGATCIGAARDLVAAHRRAEAALREEPVRLAVGLSHHLVGADLPDILERLRPHDPALTVALRVGETRGMLDAIDAGELDAAVVLRHDESRRGGEVLATEGFGWFARSDFAPPAGAPLPIATQPEPCHLRAMAVRALDGSGIPWREAFVGGGVVTNGAAAAAGLAVALLARRVAPAGTVDVGPRLGLPRLPRRDVVLHSSVSDPRANASLRTVADAFRPVAAT